MSVSLSFIGKSKRCDGGTLRCRETGTNYSFDRLGSEFMVHYGDFEPIGFRPSRETAVTLIEQTARLDFLSAQAETGAYAA